MSMKIKVLPDADTIQRELLHADITTKSGETVSTEPDRKDMVT